MSTTNISQIISSVLVPSNFSRKDQYHRVISYTLALSLPRHVNQSQMAKYMPISQSSISRMLSTNAISTDALIHSRIKYMHTFLDSIHTSPKYLILDETVIKRYGKKKIEKMGKFYSSVENRIVNGIQLLQSLVWINSRVYFPLFVDIADNQKTSIHRFVSMLGRVRFNNLILLTDGGITCSELFFQAKRKGYTLIGRVRSNMNIVLNGVKVSLNQLRDSFTGVHSMIAYVPEYRDWVKIVLDNRMETKMYEKNKKGRIILCSDTSMNDFEILGHYSKRTYIETYFKYAKNELGLKSIVYSSKSMLRHTELVELYFTIWMISQFWRNVKDRMGLREFIEQMRIFYYDVLLELIVHDSSFYHRLKSFFDQTCII